MSHISTIEMEITDLSALKAACSELGLTFQDKQTYHWYGGENPCDHAISVLGAHYEIGVCRVGQGYVLCFDGWQAGGLPSVLGEGCGRLKQAYAVARVRAEARRRGMRVTEKRKDTTIRLVLRA